jgi:hypothetical protein
MFSPRNFGRKKDRSTNHHLSSTFAGPSSSIITSDAYGFASTNSFSTMKVNKQDPTSPRSMDFQPYSDWNIPSKAGCTSGLWQFAQFDTKTVPPPTPPPNPPNIIRQVLKFPKKARNQFRVGDCEQETRAPLSSMCCNIETKENIANGRTPKVQEPKRKFLNGKLRNLLTPKMSNRRIPNLTIATTLSSSTEPLSDDDDSIWNAMQSQQTNIAKNLSIKYSRRSEISDGSATAQVSAADIMKRALRPNSTHVNVSYWTERNLRPYMEDRVLIDRVGSTLPVFISEISEEISIPALVNGLDEIDELVSTGPIHIDSISFGQNPISLYSVFDGHAGALASQFCSDWFSSYLVKQPLFHTNLPKALESTFKSIDRDFMSTGNRDGTTACVCVVIGGKRVICANAGDSRAIIVKNDGSFVPLSTDHKPGKEKEARRILDLGGKILFNGSWRVEGLVQKNLIDFVLS